MRDQLSAWLGRDDIEVEQVSGGSSNLTFRVRSAGDDWILRRPPEGRVLATASDMAREWTVLSALLATDVPVPRVVRTCDDPSVIGVPFYLMERLGGIVFNDAADVGHLSEAQALACSYELMDVLARLHRVDPESVGLQGFGRPEGFVGRQVRRWSTQWAASKRAELPEIDEVARRLAASVPPEQGSSIVHGDYSFNNTMFFRERPTTMQAVLDWEMSTLGDPLTDVGMVAIYWADVGELMWRNREHPQPHRLNPGFPKVGALLDRYADASGRDLSGIDFYRALATFKLAIIVEGASVRLAAAGETERLAEADRLVHTLAHMALDATGALQRR